jgi:multidrug resistance efflux pump
LTTTGVVRARPEARAVITPPVSGRITLNSNVRLGGAVGRGQQIGTIEQILGAPEQASLEGQRISLRTAALEQQARATEQQSLAAQARTRLTQAQRELQRARNLLEVGAAPRRRVEEAETAVKLAGQEVAAAEQQSRVAQQQVRLSNESVRRVDSARNFPLTAPVTGIISDIRASSGQQVETGMELMTVINLTTVFIEAQVLRATSQRRAIRGRATSPRLRSAAKSIASARVGDGRLVSSGKRLTRTRAPCPSSMKSRIHRTVCAKVCSSKSRSTRRAARRC